MADVVLLNTWKPPLTHMLVERDGMLRTLCGVQIGDDWEIGEPKDNDLIIDEIACGCLRCSKIAVNMIAKREPGNGSR